MSSNQRSSDTTNHAKNGLKIAAITIAAPIATSTAITAAGFTTAGIAKGSFAAFLMSKWAILTGGEIAKGSPIAIAQSIGTTGLLSPYLIPVAIVAGTVTAAVVYGPKAVKYVKEQVDEHNNKDDETTPLLS